MKIINSIKAFFYIFTKSLTSIKYYRDLVSAKTALSVKYFLTLMFLATLVITTYFGVVQTPAIYKGVNELITQGKAMYPQDLIISVKGGAIKVNKPEPYIVATPEQWLNEMEKDTTPLPQNLVVFDSNGTINDFDKYKTLVIVNSANILMQEQGKINAYPTKDMPDNELTKEKFVEFMDLMVGYAKTLPYVLLVLEFVGILIFLMVFRFMYVLIVGLVLWVFGKIRKFEYGYEVYLRVAIHTFTLPLVLWIITLVVGVSIPIPFWGFLINLVFGGLAVSGLRVKDASGGLPDSPQV
ncbi:MAG: hypothetical protein ACD_22C00044G0002 [uncultured bacterium]|nr:MAG: hypothetical protein ACD_22C00044G0002 [uncultured bacterium]